MALMSLVKKLRIQRGQRATILNAPPGYVDELDPLPDGVKLAETIDGIFDFLHLFVRDRAELERFGPTALSIVKHDGIFWISYPRKSARIKTDITRDDGWDVIVKAGLRPVSQISINAIWSALLFRPTELVGE